MLAIVIAIIFLYPFYLIIINSLKTFGGVLDNPLALPKELVISGYSKAMRMMRYPQAFFNTVVVTTIAVSGRILFGSMAAYKLQRTKTRYSFIIYLFFVSPMLIPFHSIMFSFLKFVIGIGLNGSILGLGIVYLGFCSFDIFLFYNFISTIPLALEESATIDGASSWRVYFQIVFPLLKPVSITVTVLVAMATWNDFIVPLLLINSSPKTRTLTLSTVAFYGQYSTQWNIALSGLILTIIPILIVFLAMQKHISAGITAGALKN